jgi:integrase
MGGVYKRGKVWWISYQSGGKQFRESSHSTNKVIAQKLLAKRQGEVIEARLGLPPSNAPRLPLWADEFLKSVSHPNTRDRYECSVKALKRVLGGVKINEITPEAVFRFQQQRKEEGVTSATINRDRAVLSRMLNIAKKRRLLGSNPCESVDPLNEKRTRRKAAPFTYEEERAITANSTGWFQMLFILLVETGMRAKKEALPLKWEDVHFELEPTRIFIKTSKSDAGIRAAYLTEYGKKMLMQWRQLIGDEVYVFPSPLKPGHHICDYQDAWRQAAKNAGVHGHIFYDTRATFASRVNAGCQTETTIARMLGHESTKLVPTYAKPIDENTRAAVRALDEQRLTHQKTDYAATRFQ